MSSVVHGARGEDIRATLPYGGSRSADAIRAEQQELIGRAPQARLRLRAAGRGVPAQPHRPGRAALRADRRRAYGCRPPGCPGSWPCSAGTASSPACRRCRSCRSWPRRRCGRWPACRGTGWTTSATRSPARSCTSCGYGETAAFEERPHSPYYGVGRLDAAVPHPARRVRALDRRRRARPRAGAAGPRGAAAGSTTTATCDGDGYVEYERRNPETGLENQCWKDSWDSISYADGTLPGVPPRHLRDAGLRLRREDARRPGWPGEFWDDPAFADRLEREAAELKERFNRDFWIADGELLRAGAGRRRPPGATRSPPTSATCCGAASSTTTRAGDGAPSTCSGRGCSPAGGCARWPTGEGRYNPIGYHVGTVWPHDNSFIAWGLRRYGFDEEAGRHRRRHPRGGRATSTAGCRRRSPATPRDLTNYPVRVPDRVQPAGLVDRHAAAAAADDARPGAARAST